MRRPSRISIRASSSSPRSRSRPAPWAASPITRSRARWSCIPRTGNDSAQNGGPKNPEAKGDESSPEASIFFVYYAKDGARPEARPITFIFNGGPGSATVWLHMGAWGPKRVVTAEDTHSPAAPYQLIDNDQTLLDASDLVFIDAPSTGFSRIAGKDKEEGVSTASIPTARRLRPSSRSSWRSTTASTRRNTCSARVTARRARRFW